MSNKTSQLQIRISPEQKETLKRLAAAAGLSVSEYVLTAALPAERAEFGRLAAEFSHPERRTDALSELRSFLAALPTVADLSRAIDDFDPSRHTPYVANCLAAAVEDELVRRGAATERPRWIDAVAPLEAPRFDWAPRSLRPHLMRITPVAYKRRNVFIDAAAVEARS